MSHRSHKSSGIEETLQIAVGQHRAGRLDAAASLYRDILDVAPQCADARHLLGVVAHQNGDHELAIQHISTAIALNASAADFHLNLGSAHQAMDHLDEAIDCFECSIRLNPHSAVAHNNLGNALKARGRIGDALEQYNEALRLDPDYAEAYCNLGTALTELGELDAAQASLKRALQINPLLVEAHSNLGIVYERRGETDAANGAYCNALVLDPRLAEAWSNLGHLLRDQGNVTEAREAYRQVGELRPQPLWKLRTALPCPVIPQSNEEIDEFRRRLEVAIESFKGVRLCDSPDDLASSNCEPPFYLSYQGRNDRVLKSDYAKLFVREFPRSSIPVRDGIVHVGFVVADRREAVFIRFMRGILNRLSSSDLKVSIACSSSGRQVLTQAIADERIEYVTLPGTLSDAASALRSAAFDVLFFFEVGTDSLSYFLPFYRSSPVQCTSWGVPVTTGIPAMDCFISSDLLEPEGCEAHYSERLFRMRTLPVCYDRPVPRLRRNDRTAFGLPQHDHLYLCPQSLFKIHPEFDETLAGILRRDPLGKVLFLDGKHRRWMQLLRQRFARSIPDVRERIVFLPPQSHENFVGLLQSCDVMLDPHHFGGGATTYEALAVGAPIVTLPASFMRGRVTAACYRKMGLMDCVATTVDDYVERAVRLGTSRDYREGIRSTILSTNEVLYDDANAVKELREFFFEAAYSARSGAGSPSNEGSDPPGVSI